jgi:hypothetical protein
MKQEVESDLQLAVEYMEFNFGIECTLTEILQLRRNVVTAKDIETKALNGRNKCVIWAEAVAMLLHTHYGINWMDLWDISDVTHNRAQGAFRELIRSDEEEVWTSNAFKEYMRSLQRDSYFP